ncbi:uncharacterized protein C8Q71DRAFT_853034 [Rhodofomes roseus]|uniref:Uncharacterized protein n=1 Tax=Rhodofomes roseus TaxID=34475 RepID=A0ABQ8KUJ5_9APHY|nr:uncharacterized protein C8Q71DRAFT_853034 [Rhodofomes roseus]KAH9842486.1 hypothetical protein C8Q71DRAFT_853034 [Rhodofomes roseus]
MRKLKELEDFIDVSVICPHIGERGWPFHVKDLYLRAAPDYEGRFTVPILWDKQQNKSPSCASTQSTSATSSATSVRSVAATPPSIAGSASYYVPRPYATRRPPTTCRRSGSRHRLHSIRRPSLDGGTSGGRHEEPFVYLTETQAQDTCRRHARINALLHRGSIGSDTSETMVENFDATTSMRTRSAYRLVPINKDARILRFEDEE